MAATQQSAEMTSSQLTTVGTGETKPPQSAQKPRIDSTNETVMANTQNVTQNAGDKPSGDGEHSAGKNPSFPTSLHQYRETLNNDFAVFQENIDNAGSPEESIDDFDWEDLENEYQKEIADIVMRERDIMGEFDNRFKQFMLWMQVSDERENQRAIKRIKTQSAFVQISEQELARKEQHYADVMQAFQNAMSLLGRQS